MNSIRTVIGSTCFVALVAAAFGCSSDGDGGDAASGAGGGAGTAAGTGGSMAGTGTAGAAAGAPAAGAPAGGAPAAGASAGGAPAAGAPAGGAPAGGAPAAGAPAGGSGGAAPPSGLPASESKDALLTFIKAGSYKNAPWKAESAAPRAATAGLGSPHGKVRVWMNETLLKSLSAGMKSKPSQYSMSVKELYGETDDLVGHAVTYHSGAGDDGNSYTFLCVGPSGRCFSNSPAATEASPVYGKGLGVQCGFCHSTLGQPFITPPPQ